MTSYRFTTADTGCYLDGALGWHNTYRIVDLAESEGWHVSPNDRLYVDAYRAAADSMTSPETGDEISRSEIADAVYEIATEAFDYLNTLCEPGVSFEWIDGGLDLLDDGADGRL